MAQLADALAQVRLNEIAQAEALITSHVAALLPPEDLDEETQRHLAPFVQFAPMPMCDTRRLPLGSAPRLFSVKRGSASHRNVLQPRREPSNCFTIITVSRIQYRRARHVGHWIGFCRPSNHRRSWTKEEKEQFAELPPRSPRSHCGS